MYALLYFYTINLWIRIISTPVSLVRKGNQAKRRWEASTSTAQHCTSLTLSLGNMTWRQHAKTERQHRAQWLPARCPSPHHQQRQEWWTSTSNTCRHTYLVVDPSGPVCPPPCPPTYHYREDQSGSIKVLGCGIALPDVCSGRNEMWFVY